MGPVEEGPREASVGGAAELPGVGPGGGFPCIEVVEKAELFVEVGGAGLEPVGLAGGVPADGDGGLGEPGDGPAAGDAEPEVPVEGIAVGRVEPAGFGRCALS